MVSFAGFEIKRWHQPLYVNTKNESQERSAGELLLE